MKTFTETSDSSQWLSNLPKYNCPMCGNETIFRHGCGACVDIEDRKERLIELEIEIPEMLNEMLALNKQLSECFYEYKNLRGK